MNKKLKAKVCAAVVTCSLLAVQSLVNVGPVGVDVVSAASTSTSTSTSSSSSSSSSSTSSTSSGSTYVSSGTSSSYKGLLSVGASGSAVKSLQTSLNKHGYKLTVDGFFGPLTSAAVKDFQKKNGLVVDGIVGPATNGKLNPVTATAAVLGVGSTGSAVKTMQTNLNKVGGYKLVADGIFGPKTLAAVKDFQKKNGLAVDGWAGPLTLGKLNAKVKAASTTTTTPPKTTTGTTTTTPPVDVKAAASLVKSITELKASIAPKSKGGNWITATTKDLVTEQDLRLDGNFVNKHTPAAIQRKLALYTQEDATHKVTARFSLTAHSITIVSPNASIEHGTFNGDIYVSAPNFKLVNTIVNGNIYFTNQTAKDTFKGAVDVTPDKDSVATKINGTQVLKLNADIDVATTASTNIKTNDAFKAAISKTGTWIAAPFTDLTFTEDLTVDGDIMWEGALARKIALYAHSNDGDARTTTDRFILTAPKLTINSPNASIQHGVFVGDVYVNKTGFKLTDAIVFGKIYFANQALKDSFKMDADSTVTGGSFISAN